MLESIVLRFTENDDLTLPADGITIFVGPNNSGKSLILREIERAFREHPFPGGLRVLKDYEIRWPTPSELDQAIAKFERFKQPGAPEGAVCFGLLTASGGLETGQIQEDGLRQIANAKGNKNWWLTQFCRWGVLRLDGRSRFSLTNDKEAGDLGAPPKSVLTHLFQDDVARAKVRSLVFDAFGLYFSIDPTNLGKMRICLSQQTPLKDEQSLNAEAREYYKNATHIREASDGVQAYSGILTAILSGEFHTVLIDEPEAFLHPPLARKLGKNLASISEERKGVLFASTHSPDFLMGCIQTSNKVRVVRLEYGGGKSRGRMVDPAQLVALLKKPLMRSANVVSGLFHDGVIVTESDNDRAFYAEIYHRLAESESDHPSILFVNAQNKQTIPSIIGPLRKFGVPAVAISDIDILKDGGKTWGEWLGAAQIPQALRDGFASQRSSIHRLFEQAGKDMKADGGVDALAIDERKAAGVLFDSLDSFGIFVVRRGEVENWLPHLGVPGRKTDWTISMLERLGSDPHDSNFVRPATTDVWEFIRSISRWIKDPARRGMS